MSSAGQVAGGIVGAVSGFLLGGPLGSLYGAQIGMTLGGLIDPPQGPTTDGPRLSDLSVQSSTYGAVIPRVYGTVTVSGNVFWLENNKLKETITKKKVSGGKGGGGRATTRVYSYFGTFAAGLCAGPIAGVRRIWIGPDLYYDAGSADVGTITASNAASKNFRVYLGTDTQQPDPRMQATLGVADTPAWRGLAYIVFYDLPLARYANSLPMAQITVEVMHVAAIYDYPVTRNLGAISNKSWIRPAWTGSAFFTLTGRYTTSQNSFATSPDGYTTWQEGTMPASGDSSPGWRDVASSPSGTLIAVRKYSSASAVARSTDNGSTWSWQNLPGAFFPERVAYGGGIFVVICHLSGQSLYSNNDGVTWFVSSLPHAADYCSEIHYCEALGKFFVALYKGAGAYNHIISSTNGVSWTEAPVHPSANWNFLASMGSTVVVGSTYASDGILVSADGVTWSRKVSPEYPCGAIDGIESDGLVFLFLQRTKYWYTADLAIYTEKQIPYSGNTLPAPPRWSGFNFCFVPYSGTDGQVGTIPRAMVSPGVEPLSTVVSLECLSSGLLTAGDIDASGLSASVRGYRVGTVGAIRAALEVLQGAWPFDVRQHGYKIQFIPRGGASVATIPAADLDARAAGQPAGVRLTTSREMDAQLQRRVTVQFLDADREYNAGSQYAERLNSSAINVAVLDLPIALTATEAAGKAEVLLYMYWMERHEATFTLPPTYGHLEPGDVITVNAPDGALTLRLTAIHYTSDGRIECQAKYADAAVYTPTAIGASPVSTGPTTITPSGGSTYTLLDVPMMTAEQSVPSFLAAMTGSTAGWPGGSLLQTMDAGSTWSILQDFDPPGAVIGTCTNAIGVADARVVDTASVLSVTLMQGALYSTTRLALLGGANHFAYGADGRWEIIAAQSCVQVSGTSYELRDFLRGRYGTEWAMTLHASGDTLVLLDAADVAMVKMGAGTIGLSYVYRGVTADQDISTGASKQFYYRGVNLKPLSPVYATGSRDPVTGDWSLSWIRRTRDGGEWRDYVDATLGEATEGYAVEVYSGPSYQAIKRTLSVATAECVYPLASQVTDFGAAQSTIHVRIYQVSAVVGRGYPLTASLTR